MDTGVIGHQGGWDEALLVAIPMLVVASLLWLAKRRVNAAESRTADSRDDGSNPLDAGADGREAAD